MTEQRNEPAITFRWPWMRSRRAGRLITAIGSIRYRQGYRDGVTEERAVSEQRLLLAGAIWRDGYHQAMDDAHGPDDGCVKAFVGSVLADLDELVVEQSGDRS